MNSGEKAGMCYKSPGGINLPPGATLLQLGKVLDTGLYDPLQYALFACSPYFRTQGFARRKNYHRRNTAYTVLRCDTWVSINIQFDNFDIWLLLL